MSEVRFAGDGAPVAVPPARAKPRLVIARVPAGAASGKVRVAAPDGKVNASRGVLRVVPASAVPNRFRLTAARLRPRLAFFGQSNPVRLRFRFEAPERSGVRVEVVRASGKRTVRTFRRPDRLPYRGLSQAWNGLAADGDVAADGAYRFRVGAFGERSYAAGQTILRGFKFPVRGPHSYGGYLQSFGAPRSGGRRHEGQDVYAACGTRLEAARGGRIQRRDYDPELLGHYIVIDTHASSTDHLYVHMPSASPFGEGARVHTGERVGAVGKTGNARTTPCHLHFEIWPNGWHNGSAIDPLGALRRWDGYS